MNLVSHKVTLAALVLAVIYPITYFGTKFAQPWCLNSNDGPGAFYRRYSIHFVTQMLLDPVGIGVAFYEGIGSPQKSFGTIRATGKLDLSCPKESPERSRVGI